MWFVDEHIMTSLVSGAKDEAEENMVLNLRYIIHLWTSFTNGYYTWSYFKEKSYNSWNTVACELPRSVYLPCTEYYLNSLRQVTC